MAAQRLIFTLLLAKLAAAVPEPCSLKASGPVEVQSDGEVVENLFITTDSTSPGIYVRDKKNVVIRNVRIQHHAQTEWPYGNGIFFQGSDDITIDNVEVELVGHSSGPLPDHHNYNIFGAQSARPKISNLRVKGGSTGVELDHCDGGHVWNFVAQNVRGPFPRGQCFQASASNDALLEDFYCLNDETSWTEDSISFWGSANATARRGVIDGNNSPTGVGVMIEPHDASIKGGLVEDIDAIRQGDGCFSTFSGQDIRFVRTRCRENHCDGWSGREPATSDGLMYAAGDVDGVTAHNVQLEEGQYFASCNPGFIIWEKTDGAWTKKDIEEVDFEMRQPLSVHLCWDESSIAV